MSDFNPMSIFDKEIDKPASSFFTKICANDRPPNSEAYYKDSETIELTIHRWDYFLSRGEEVAFPYIIDSSGRLNIDLLVYDCGYRIIHCEDMVFKLMELSQEQQYKMRLKTIPQENKDIVAFSLPQTKKIFVNATVEKEKQSFAIAHELSHGLLHHEGNIFFRMAGDYHDKSFEDKVYTKEADKLAAILLMPHFLVRDLLEEADEKLAEQFGVSVKAIKERKKEVKREIHELCYVPIMEKEDLEEKK